MLHLEKTFAYNLCDGYFALLFSLDYIWKNNNDKYQDENNNHHFL